MDGTGAQDLFFETDEAIKALEEAIESGDTQPDEVITDPGFALTQANLEEKRMDMWGNALNAEEE